jgi:hypothetical protein
VDGVRQTLPLIQGLRLGLQVEPLTGCRGGGVPGEAVTPRRVGSIRPYTYIFETP